MCRSRSWRGWAAYTPLRTLIRTIFVNILLGFYINKTKKKTFPRRIELRAQKCQRLTPAARHVTCLQCRPQGHRITIAFLASSGDHIYWDVPPILTVLNRDSSRVIIPPSKDCLYKGKHPNIFAIRALSFFLWGGGGGWLLYKVTQNRTKGERGYYRGLND